MKRSMSGTVINDPLKIVIFLGSTRTNRMVDRVCAYVKTIVENKGMLPVIMGTLSFYLQLKFLYKTILGF